MDIKKIPTLVEFYIHWGVIEGWLLCSDVNKDINLKELAEDQNYIWFYPMQPFLKAYSILANAVNEIIDGTGLPYFPYGSSFSYFSRIIYYALKMGKIDTKNKIITKIVKEFFKNNDVQLKIFECMKGYEEPLLHMAYKYGNFLGVIKADEEAMEYGEPSLILGRDKPLTYEELCEKFHTNSMAEDYQYITYMMATTFRDSYKHRYKNALHDEDIINFELALTKAFPDEEICAGDLQISNSKGRNDIWASILELDLTNHSEDDTDPMLMNSFNKMIETIYNNKEEFTDKKYGLHINRYADFLITSKE